MPAPVIGMAAGVTAVTGCAATDRRDGTDAITLRRASFIEQPPSVATGNGPFLQSSKCADEPPGSQPFVVATSESDFVLHNRGTSAGTCGALAGVRRLQTRTYYVRNTGATSSLARIDVVDGVELAPVDVVDNIENVRFQYGFDTNGDGVADRYLPESGVVGTPGDVNNRWADVVTVRVFVIARAPQSTPGYSDKKVFLLPGLDASDPSTFTAAANDNFKRHMKTSLVRVLNTAGRREGS
jgi:type IV pilus assembly protein PilW